MLQPCSKYTPQVITVLNYTVIPLSPFIIILSSSVFTRLCLRVSKIIQRVPISGRPKHSTNRILPFRVLATAKVLISLPLQLSRNY